MIKEKKKISLKEPFHIDESFKAFNERLKVDIMNVSKEKNMPLFYKNNGINIKESPDGRKYEIKFLENGEYQIVKEL